MEQVPQQLVQVKRGLEAPDSSIKKPRLDVLSQEPVPQIASDQQILTINHITHITNHMEQIFLKIFTPQLAITFGAPTNNNAAKEKISSVRNKLIKEQATLQQIMDEVKAESEAVGQTPVVVSFFGNAGNGKTYITNMFMLDKEIGEHAADMLGVGHLDCGNLTQFANVVASLNRAKFGIIPLSNEKWKATEVPTLVYFTYCAIKDATVHHVYVSKEEYVARVESEIQNNEGLPLDAYQCHLEGGRIVPNENSTINFGNEVLISPAYWRCKTRVELALAVHELLAKPLEPATNVALDFVKIVWPSSTFSGMITRDLPGLNAEIGWRRERVKKHAANTDIILAITVDRPLNAEDFHKMKECGLFSETNKTVPQVVEVLNATKTRFATTIYEPTFDTGSGSHFTRHSAAAFQALNPSCDVPANLHDADVYTLDENSSEWRHAKFADMYRLLYFYELPVCFTTGEHYHFFEKMQQIKLDVENSKIHRLLFPISLKLLLFHSLAGKAVLLSMSDKADLKQVRNLVKSNEAKIEKTKNRITAITQNFMNVVKEIEEYDLIMDIDEVVEEFYKRLTAKSAHINKRKLATNLADTLVERAIANKFAEILQLNVKQCCNAIKLQVCADLEALIRKVFPGKRSPWVSYTQTNLLTTVANLRDSWVQELTIHSRLGALKQKFSTHLQQYLVDNIDKALTILYTGNTAIDFDVLLETLQQAIKATLCQIVQEGEGKILQGVCCTLQKVSAGVISFIDDSIRLIQKSDYRAYTVPLSSSDHLIALRKELRDFRKQMAFTPQLYKRTIPVVSKRTAINFKDFYFSLPNTRPKEMSSHRRDLQDRKYQKGLLVPHTGETRVKSTICSNNPDNYEGRLIKIETTGTVMQATVPELILRTLQKNNSLTQPMPPIFVYGISPPHLKDKFVKGIVETFMCNEHLYNRAPMHFFLPVTEQNAKSVYRHYQPAQNVFFYHLPEGILSKHQNMEVILLLAETLKDQLTISNLVYFAVSEKITHVRRYNPQTFKMENVQFYTALRSLSCVFQTIQDSWHEPARKYIKENQAKILQDLHNILLESGAFSNFTTKLLTPSLDKAQDIDYLIAAIPDENKRQEFTKMLNWNLCRIGPISISSNLDKVSFYREAQFKVSATVTGFCLLNTLSMSCYNPTTFFAKRDSTKRGYRQNDNVLSTLLHSKQENGLLCFLNYEYQLTCASDENLQVRARKGNASAQPLVKLPQLGDLACCFPGRLENLTLQLKKQGFSMHEPASEETLYDCISRATTGNTTSSGNIKKIIQKRSKSSMVRMQKQQFYKNLQPAHVDGKQAYTEYLSKALPKGDPLLLNLWSTKKGNIVSLICEDCNGAISVFCRKSKSTTLAKPFCLAWVQGINGPFFLNVEKNTIETDEEKETTKALGEEDEDYDKSDDDFIC